MRRSTITGVFTPPTTIDVVLGPELESGTRIVVGFMPAGAMTPDRYQIPYYDHNTKKGYQRPPQEARISQLAGELRRGRTDLPTAVLLNIRNRNAEHAVIDGKLDLGMLQSQPARAPTFYVVDGQHRILALKKLLEENFNDWAQFQIPFVCMLGANDIEEMNQFYIVNSTSKSVRTDLALSLLKKRVDEDPALREDLQRRGRDWQVDGQSLVERLAIELPAWRDRIRFPAMEKGTTTITSSSMVASLKPLLGSPYFGGLKPDQQLRVLNAYWEGLREVLRPAFDEPERFALQKGVGVVALHTILLYVIEIIRNAGHSVTEATSYAEILKESLDNLQGDSVDEGLVRGIDFWAAAPKGAAGSYSGSAGRRVLVAKLKQLLPSVDLD